MSISERGQADTDVTRPPSPSGTIATIDEIRELLFGAVQRDQDEKLSRLEADDCVQRDELHELISRCAELERCCAYLSIRCSVAERRSADLEARCAAQEAALADVANVSAVLSSRSDRQAERLAAHDQRLRDVTDDLRAKLGAGRIRTRHGFGYCLVDPRPKNPDA